jgi:PAS domain S-box-containing protein
VVGVNIDITERKQAELALAALAESNAQLTLAGKAARVGHFAYDLDTGLVTVSEGYAVIYGLPEPTTQITHDQWQATVHPDDLAQYEELRRQMVDSRRTDYRFDYRIIRGDGEVRWIDSRRFVSYDGEGRPQRMIGIVIDVTERKQTEQTLAERNAQLELANRIGRIGSFTIDYAAGVIRLSPGCATLYGLPENTIELSGQAGWKFVHPEDLTGLIARLKQAFQERRPEFVAQFRIVRADNGEVRWVETRSIVSHGEDGRPLRMVGVSIDFTDLRAIEHQKSVLIAELDHRVKNTLATVSAVISRTQHGSRSVANFVAALDGRIRSMATTHELLSSGRWQGVSLGEIVRRELTPYTAGKNTEIHGSEIVLCPEAGQAMAMVLHELATNAAKYGALSSKNGRVSIRWDQRSNGQSRSHLVFQWQEIGGPPVEATGKPSYGASIIRDLIPYEFGGAVDLVLAPDGLSCRLELPSDWLMKDGAPALETIASALSQRGSA